MSLTSVPGDPAALDAAARTLTARAAALDGAADRITRLSAPLADLRTASALRATERLAETGGGARAVGRLLTAVATVLAAFRGAVASLQAAARAAAEAYDDALQRQTRWALEEERLRAQVLEVHVLEAHVLEAHVRSVIPPLEAAALHQRLRTAQHERARADDDARRAAAQHADVVAQHHDEAARTAARLQALADTRAVRAWALEAGAGTVAQFQASRAAGVAAAQRVRELAGMNPAAVRATDAAAAAMLDALRRGGDDPVFWTTLLGAVGARDLVVAADHAAPRTSADAYRGGRSDDWGTILDALTVGALAWAPSASPAARAAFGREIGGAVVGDGDAGSQVAQALLGQHSRAAGAGGDLASRGDETAFAQVAAGVLERLDDERPALDEPYPTANQGTPALAAAAAFADLARDPGIAFDYLAADDPRALDDRARRWLGTDIAWPDHGLGVATAFGTAVLTGVGSGKRLAEARSAQLVSVATDVLPGGLLGRRAPLPPAAERAVATAYGPYLQTAGDLSARTDVAGVVGPAPAAERTPVDGRPGTRPDAPLAFGLGAMPQVIQARLDPFMLREVVAGTSRTSAGAATWLALDEAYEDAVLATVLPPDGSAPAAWTRIDDDADVAAAVRELHRDTGAVEGALQVRSVERAEVVEQGREAGVDLVMTVTTGGVGSGLVKGVEKGIKAGGRHSSVSFSNDQLLNFFVSKGGDKVGGLAEEMLDQEVAPTEERVALDETHREADATRRAFLAAVRSSVAGGDSAQQAVERWAALDPGNVDAGESFRRAYDVAADPDTGIDPRTRERRDPEAHD